MVPFVVVFAGTIVNEGGPPVQHPSLEVQHYHILLNSLTVKNPHCLTSPTDVQLHTTNSCGKLMSDKELIISQCAHTSCCCYVRVCWTGAWIRKEIGQCVVGDLTRVTAELSCGIFDIPLAADWATAMHNMWISNECAIFFGLVVIWVGCCGRKQDPPTHEG